MYVRIFTETSVFSKAVFEFEMVFTFQFISCCFSRMFNLKKIYVLFRITPGLNVEMQVNIRQYYELNYY